MMYLLHDHALMQYGDKLEASRKCLPELLNLSTEDLSSQFGMKRGHIARFMDRINPCTDPLPESHSLTARKIRGTSRNNSIYKNFASISSNKMQSTAKSFSRSITNNERLLEDSLADFKLRDGYVFKGIVAAGPAEPRACGCVQPPVVDNVAPYSSLENISVQKLTPEHKIGMERLVKSKTPPMKASELWRDKPAVLLFSKD